MLPYNKNFEDSVRRCKEGYSVSRKVTQSRKATDATTLKLINDQICARLCKLLKQNLI
jgi:hypothetical protein